MNNPSEETSSQILFKIVKIATNILEYSSLKDFMQFNMVNDCYSKLFSTAQLWAPLIQVEDSTPHYAREMFLFNPTHRIRHVGAYKNKLWLDNQIAQYKQKKISESQETLTARHQFAHEYLLLNYAKLSASSFDGLENLMDELFCEGENTYDSLVERFSFVDVTNLLAFFKYFMSHGVQLNNQEMVAKVNNVNVRLVYISFKERVDKLIKNYIVSIDMLLDMPTQELENLLSKLPKIDIDNIYPIPSSNNVDSGKQLDLFSIVPNDFAGFIVKSGMDGSLFSENAMSEFKNKINQFYDAPYVTVDENKGLMGLHCQPNEQNKRPHIFWYNNSLLHDQLTAMNNSKEYLLQILNMSSCVINRYHTAISRLPVKNALFSLSKKVLYAFVNNRAGSFFLHETKLVELTATQIFRPEIPEEKLILMLGHVDKTISLLKPLNQPLDKFWALDQSVFEQILIYCSNNASAFAKLMDTSRAKELFLDASLPLGSRQVILRDTDGFIKLTNSLDFCIEDINRFSHNELSILLDNHVTIVDLVGIFATKEHIYQYLSYNILPIIKAHWELLVNLASERAVGLTIYNINYLLYDAVKYDKIKDDLEVISSYIKVFEPKLELTNLYNFQQDNLEKKEYKNKPIVVDEDFEPYEEYEYHEDDTSDNDNDNDDDNDNRPSM